MRPNNLCEICNNYDREVAAAYEKRGKILEKKVIRIADALLQFSGMSVEKSCLRISESEKEVVEL